jgi:hypothetical protein
LETMQDEASPPADSKVPTFNVSCQTCRITMTFFTLQGVNAFFSDHEGHSVIEGRLFERPQKAKKPEEVAEEVSKPSLAEGPAEEVVASAEEVVSQEPEPQVEDAAASAEVVAREPQTQVEEIADVPAQEAPAPLPQATQPVEPVGAALSLLSEKDLKEPLLLARSSYIGESEEKRIDALRVSRVLKEFKWNVEPPYVIGVMVDDNLSVETNIGVISSSMVERMGKLGYKFVAVNAPQGSPVAWFKKDVNESLETNFPVGEAERSMQIRKGKRTYNEDKAVWEESFVSLLMTVKDMDGEKLKRVTNIIRSERPEPDLKS